jgi:hypothetical protein
MSAKTSRLINIPLKRPGRSRQPSAGEAMEAAGIEPAFSGCCAIVAGGLGFE